MKKILFAALMAVAITGSTLAAEGTNARKVSVTVLRNFEKEFGEVQDVSWSVKEGFTKATFIRDGVVTDAFFDEDAELIATAHGITKEELPVKALQKLGTCYAEYDIREAIAFTKGCETRYYLSLEKGDKKQMVTVSASGNVSEYYPNL